MRIEIEIPKEFEGDYSKDRFDEFFCRVLSDISDGTTCGRYERETAEMFLKAFSESKIAYDVEAVVSELVELRKQGYCQRVDMERCSESKSCIKCYEETLREIVRGKE